MENAFKSKNLCNYKWNFYIIQVATEEYSK